MTGRRCDGPENERKNMRNQNLPNPNRPSPSLPQYPSTPENRQGTLPQRDREQDNPRKLPSYEKSEGTKAIERAEPR
jgi:hypothetical protein